MAAASQLAGNCNLTISRIRDTPELVDHPGEAAVLFTGQREGIHSEFSISAVLSPSAGCEDQTGLGLSPLRQSPNVPADRRAVRPLPENGKRASQGPRHYDPLPARSGYRRPIGPAKIVERRTRKHDDDVLP